MYDIPRLKIVAPSISEQEKIRTYTQPLLELIQKEREKLYNQLELIDELRASTIHQAVTKGLDPNVPMKDSGVEWIGDIPAHWKVKRFRRLFQLRSGYGFPLDFQGRGYSGDGIPFYKVGDLIDPNPYYVDVDDTEKKAWKPISSKFIATAKIGAALFLNRRSIVEGPALIDNNMLGLVPDVSMSFNYAMYLTRIIDFGFFANPGAVPSLDLNRLRDYKLPTPRRSDQERIVGYIEREMAAYSVFEESFMRQIVLLEEYKNSLISEVVTGKVKVQ